ncbi:hypothetical protein [Caballeronia udeis]|uniref:hypothetical protein n=1 Tax=Caballeronia udeis TaxID=1232866 RepID=UPI0007857823|nr:hypothetical protein [Caballeronia udeis]
MQIFVVTRRSAGVLLASLRKRVLADPGWKVSGIANDKAFAGVQGIDRLMSIIRLEEVDDFEIEDRENGTRRIIVNYWGDDERRYL